jgi:hypothetical protein
MATRLVEVKNGVDDGSPIVFRQGTTLVWTFKIALNKPPFFFRKVTVVHIFNKLPLNNLVII